MTAKKIWFFKKNICDCPLFFTWKTINFQNLGFARHIFLRRKGSSSGIFVKLRNEHRAARAFPPSPTLPVETPASGVRNRACTLLYTGAKNFVWTRNVQSRRENFFCRRRKIFSLNCLSNVHAHCIFRRQVAAGRLRFVDKKIVIKKFLLPLRKIL